MVFSSSNVMIVGLPAIHMIPVRRCVHITNNEIDSIERSDVFNLFSNRFVTHFTLYMKNRSIGYAVIMF